MHAKFAGKFASANGAVQRTFCAVASTNPPAVNRHQPNTRRRRVF
jgi:hypothetical protein